MKGFLFLAAGFILAVVALGLIRILRGPDDAVRMMAAQLLGTGGIAVLLLAAGGGVAAAADAALILALLAAFASVVFVKNGAAGKRSNPKTEADP